MGKVSKPQMEYPPEHPDDREVRLRGEQYGKDHIAVFASAHAADLARLVSTWADADAQEQLDNLRQRFWSQMP